MFRLVAADGGAVRETSVPDRTNAKTWASRFSARILEPGLVSYEDVGAGKSFLTRDDIAASMNTFVGRPVILKKKKNVEAGKGRFGHEKVTPETMEDKAVGYIADWFVDGDGWFCVSGTIHDDNAKDAIREIGLCSCGYKVLGVGPGGEYHAIRYDERITKFSGEHLAIVDRPRYEGATIRLNSKNSNQQDTIMFKFWKSASRENSAEAKPGAKPDNAALKAAQDDQARIEAEKRENSVEEITGETSFEIPTDEEGKTAKVTLTELVEVYNARKNSEGTIDGEDEVDVGNGRKAKFNDVVNAYNKMCAQDEEEKKNRKNSAAPASRENSKPGHFRVLLNARTRPNSGAAAAELATRGSPDSAQDRMNRGNAIFAAKFGREVKKS